MLVSNFLGLVIFFGGGFSLVIAISQLIKKKHSITDILTALLLICLGIIQLRVFLVTSGIAVKYAFLISFLHLPVIFSVGPLLYLSYQSMLDSTFSISIKKFVHFTPAVMMALAEIIQLLLFPFDQVIAFRIEIITTFLTLYPALTLIIIKVVTLSACLYNLLYYVINIKSVLSIYSIRELDRQKLLLMLIICISIIPPAFFIIAFVITGHITNIVMAISMLSLFIFSVFFLTQRNPALLQNISLDMRRTRYERSLLTGVNIEDIYRRVTELMEDEKIYTDDRITLPILAEKLRITQHQLSEFLNEKLNMNFNTYINKYRIKEAMELLSNKDIDVSVLQIAYSIGFNSKSAFNNAFLKFTGTTPLNFRNGKVDQ